MCGRVLFSTPANGGGTAKTYQFTPASDGLTLHAINGSGAQVKYINSPDATNGFMQVRGVATRSAFSVHTSGGAANFYVLGDGLAVTNKGIKLLTGSSSANYPI